MITADEAFAQTASDPQAYNLPSDASEEQVNAKRQEAAQQLMAGSAANDAYWDSRGQLEQVIARAQGHGVVTRNAEGEAPTSTALDTSTATPAIEGSTEAPVTDAEVVPASAAPASVGETATSGGPAPSPDNPNEAIARLRAQLESLGQTPEA